MPQLCYIVARLGCPSKSIKDVKTDAFILGVDTRKLAAVKAVGTLRYDQLHTLRRTYELPTEPTHGFLNAHAEMTPERRCVQISDAGQSLAGKYTKPKRNVTSPTPICPWRDLCEADARSTVMLGQSLLVSGAPGTGKTFYVRKLVKPLHEQGKRVDIIAKTHSSVQNFGEGAHTTDHWVRLKVRTSGGIHCGVLIVEELTQMEVQLWADVCKFALSGVAFILCGDFAQFPAVCERWAGCPVGEGALERSHMVRELAGSNRFTVTENKRSDQVLFDFHTNLSARPLADALQEARLRFPVTARFATTICISHARRRYINMQRNPNHYGNTPSHTHTPLRLLTSILTST